MCISFSEAYEIEKEGDSKTEKKKIAGKYFNQNEAAHEIRRLGIGAFDKEDKKKAMVDLLVELGAKVFIDVLINDM